MDDRRARAHALHAGVVRQTGLHPPVGEGLLGTPRAGRAARGGVVGLGALLHLGPSLLPLPSVGRGVHLARQRPRRRERLHLPLAERLPLDPHLREAGGRNVRQRLARGLRARGVGARLRQPRRQAVGTRAEPQLAERRLDGGDVRRRGMDAPVVERRGDARTRHARLPHRAGRPEQRRRVPAVLEPPAPPSAGTGTLEDRRRPASDGGHDHGDPQGARRGRRHLRGAERAVQRPRGHPAPARFASEDGMGQPVRLPLPRVCAHVPAVSAAR